MGSTRLAETEAVDLRLQRYICDHITYGDRDTPVIFSVDFSRYGQVSDWTESRRKEPWTRMYRVPPSQAPEPRRH